MKGRTLKHVMSIGAICLLGVVLLTTASAATSLKTGLKVFVIPKNLGNPYFTTADSVKSGGALKALKDLKENGTETSGTAAKTRVLITSADGEETWGTVGVACNIIDASWQALVDSVEYKLRRDERRTLR